MNVKNEADQPSSSSLPLVLRLFGSATSAANAPGGQVSDHCKAKGYQQEDSNSKWLASESILKSLDTVLGWVAIIDSLEVEKETWIADTIAVEAFFNVTSEILKAFGELNYLRFVRGVSVLILLVNVLKVLVAIPEVVV